MTRCMYVCTKLMKNIRELILNICNEFSINFRNAPIQQGVLNVSKTLVFIILGGQYVSEVQGSYPSTVGVIKNFLNDKELHFIFFRCASPIGLYTIRIKCSIQLIYTKRPVHYFIISWCNKEIRSSVILIRNGFQATSYETIKPQKIRYQ